MTRTNKMKVAMWIAKINNATDHELRFQYAKLLLTILEEGVLLGPFVDEPPADLPPFPEEYSAPNVMEVLRERKERQGGSGDRPPVITEVSSDLKEYAAAQIIPKFGVHCYYAVSEEPLSEWRQAGDAAEASAAAASASAARLPAPRTECDYDEPHRADCTLCALTGSFLDEHQADFRWMEGRPLHYRRPLGPDASPPQTSPQSTAPCSPQTPSPPQRTSPDRYQRTPPCSPRRLMSPTAPLRGACPARQLSPAMRSPQGHTSPPRPGQFGSPRIGMPLQEEPTSPASPWLPDIQELILSPISDLSSIGTLGTPLIAMSYDSTSPSPTTPASDITGRDFILPFEPALSSLESLGPHLTSLTQSTPPTSLSSMPSPLSASRSPHSELSWSPPSPGTATSTPSRRSPTSPISPHSPRVHIKAEPVSLAVSEHGYSRDATPCDTNCTTAPRPQTADAVISRSSPYTTSHVPSYGKAVESQTKISEESLFFDLFRQEQQPKETIMSVVRRLKRQQAEGRERSRTYLAEIEASARRRAQIQAMRSRTPRTQAPTAAPMSAPHLGHAAPQTRQTPTSRPVWREWPTERPQFPDLFGQEPTESQIMPIARRLQQQSEESRERIRRRVAHRERRIRDRELMLQQAAGGTLRSRKESPEGVSAVRFKEEPPSETSEIIEECIQECAEEAGSPESSPPATTEESSPERSFEFPPPIWSSSIRSDRPYVPSPTYRYHTPIRRFPQIRTEESSPESGNELPPPLWSSCRRVDGLSSASPRVHGEERYRTDIQEPCVSPCAESESSGEPLPPPIWSSARRGQAQAQAGFGRGAPLGGRTQAGRAPWDTY